MPDPDRAFRFCVCGWDGHVDECPKNPHFGYCYCPNCWAMVGTGLCIGKREGYGERCRRLIEKATENTSS